MDKRRLLFKLTHKKIDKRNFLEYFSLKKLVIVVILVISYFSLNFARIASFFSALTQVIGAFRCLILFKIIIIILQTVFFQKLSFFILNFKNSKIKNTFLNCLLWYKINS